MKWYIKCLKQYADFSGRARRKEYWWFALINFIIVFILMIGWMVPLFKMGYEAGMNGGASSIDEQEAVLTLIKNPFLYIYIIYYLAMLIPGIAVTVRRLHDIGKSGYWCFLIYGGSVLAFIDNMVSTENIAIYLTLAFIVLAICILSLVWMFTDSNYGPNQYGPNPKGEGNPATEEK